MSSVLNTFSFQRQQHSRISEVLTKAPTPNPPPPWLSFEMEEKEKHTHIHTHLVDGPMRQVQRQPINSTHPYAFILRSGLPQKVEQSVADINSSEPCSVSPNPCFSFALQCKSHTSTLAYLSISHPQKHFSEGGVDTTREETGEDVIS